MYKSWTWFRTEAKGGKGGGTCVMVGFFFFVVVAKVGGATTRLSSPEGVWEDLLRFCSTESPSSLSNLS